MQKYTVLAIHLVYANSKTVKYKHVNMYSHKQSQIIQLLRHFIYIYICLMLNVSYTLISLIVTLVLKEIF